MTAAAAGMTAGDHQEGGERGRAQWRGRQGHGGTLDMGGGREDGMRRGSGRRAAGKSDVWGMGRGGRGRVQTGGRTLKRRGGRNSCKLGTGAIGRDENNRIRKRRR